MAVSGKVEWYAEAAWIHALGLNADLASVTVRRGYDDSSDRTFPEITVRCITVEDAVEPLAGYATARIEITAWTDAVDDPAGADIATTVAAIRDTLNDSALLANLEAAGNIKIYGVHLDPFAGDTSRDDDRRARTLLVLTECSVTNDIP